MLKTYDCIKIRKYQNIWKCNLKSSGFTYISVEEKNRT